VHALAIEGTFDDCQAIVKGPVSIIDGFRDPSMRLSGVNSINWRASSRRSSTYFRRVALGCPHRKDRLHGADGKFGDVFAGYVADADGPAGRAAGGCHQRQDDTWCVTAQDRSYEVRDVTRDPRRLDGHPGLVLLRTLAVDAYGATRPRCAP